MAIHPSESIDPPDSGPDAGKALDQSGQGFSPSQANILKDIFRKDAVRHSRSSLGSPIKPVGFGVIGVTIFLVLLLLVVVIFLATATYARKETVLGQITPTDGAFRINAQINGIADRVLVREGQKVKAGDELIVISSDPVLKNGETLVDSLKSIQATQRRSQELQARARSEQLERQLEELSAKRDGLHADIERLIDSGKLLDRRIHLQMQNVDAHRKLAKQGMVSPAAVRQQEDDRRLV
jgi:membrane fusion protein